MGERHFSDGEAEVIRGMKDIFSTLVAGIPTEAKRIADELKLQMVIRMDETEHLSATNERSRIRAVGTSWAKRPVDIRFELRYEPSISLARFSIYGQLSTRSDANMVPLRIFEESDAPSAARTILELAYGQQLPQAPEV